MGCVHSQEDDCQGYTKQTDDINTQDKDGWTSLHHAAFKGETTKVHALIRKRAKLNVRNYIGDTALNHAVCEGHMEVCVLLINARADIHVKNNRGKSAYDYIKSKGLLNKLKDSGAIIRKSDDDRKKNRNQGKGQLSNQNSSKQKVGGPIGKLRPIVIDGCNVAHAHGKGTFSLKGIELVLQYFVDRGHNTVVVFLPQHTLNRKNYDLLTGLEKRGHVTFTPSTRVGDKLIKSYDDRMMLDYAVEKEAIVVSHDKFRDLEKENEKYHETIRERRLQPTFIEDTLLFPQDPPNSAGLSLDNFLRF